MSLLPARITNALDKLKGPDGTQSESYLIAHARFAGRKIVEIEYGECVGLIVDMVHKAIMDIGHYKVSDNRDVVKHISIGVINLIKLKTKFRDWTIESLAIMLDMGVKGEFKKEGELDSVSVVYIERWMNAYSSNDTVKSSVKAYIDAANIREPSAPLTPYDIEMIMYNGAIDAFRKFKVDGSTPFFCKPVWQYIRHKVNFEWLPDERRHIMTEASERILAHLKTDKISGRIRNTEYIEKVKNYKQSNEYIEEKNKIAIKTYFTNLVAQKKELQLPTPQKQ